MAWGELPEWEQALHWAGKSTGAGIIAKIPILEAKMGGVGGWLGPCV